LNAPSEWGVGVLLHYNFYAAVTDNLVENVRLGLQTGNHTKPIADPATQALVRDNVFVVSLNGIYHNAQYSNGSAFTFANNAISADALAPVTSPWTGFVLQAVNGNAHAIVQGNILDGVALDGTGRDAFGYR